MSDCLDELVERIRKKDADALVKYTTEKEPQLLAFISKSLSDALKKKIEPQDILQEVCISAINSLDEIDLSQRDPFSWLCQLVERRIVDAHRKFIAAQKRTANKEEGIATPRDNSNQKGMLDILVISMTSPSGAFSRKQKEFHMLAALESMPEESRLALKFRYVENLPSKEIAKKLGKSDGAVRVLLTRSLSKLQDILSQNSVFQSFIQK